MSRFRLAIFDLDGTLVDTLPDIAAALNFTIRELGLQGISQDRVAGMVGEGVTRLLQNALGEHGAGRLERAVEMFRTRYAAHLCEGTRPYPGIPEMLAAAPQQKAVATNKPGEMARRILHELGLARHFVQVVGDDDVERRKPDPLVVRRLLEECGVDAGDTVMIGDGVVDAQTARAAGVAFYAVTWGYVPRERLVTESPARIFDTVAQLRDLLM